MPSRVQAALAFALLFGSGFAPAAESLAPPRIPLMASAARGFVPPGWRIEQIARGDLNADGLPDIALVIRENAPEKIKRNDSGPGVQVYNTNPRILAVALFMQSRDAYRLLMENPTILPGHLDPTIDDPFDHIKIQAGKLLIKTHFWANAGSYLSNTNRHVFHYENECLRLISLAQTSLDRKSGERRDLRFNLLTGSVQLVSWNEVDRSVPKERQEKRMFPPAAICIDTMGDIQEFRAVGSLGQSHPVWQHAQAG